MLHPRHRKTVKQDCACLVHATLQNINKDFVKFTDVWQCLGQVDVLFGEIAFGAAAREHAICFLGWGFQEHPKGVANFDWMRSFMPKGTLMKVTGV